MKQSLVHIVGLIAMTAAVSACSSNPTVAESATEPTAARATPLEITQSTRGPMVTLENVLFDFEEATLRAEADDMLGQTAAYLLDHPDRNAVVEGHTDRIGESNYNQWLSNLRAESVRDALIEHGVSASRIKTSGYGETHPVADNDTADGRQANRRVEIIFQRAGQSL